MRPFGEAKSISGHQTLQLMRRPYVVKGSVYVVHTPCLPKVPRRRARRSIATTRERIPHRQGDRRRPSRGTSRPTGKTGETREGNPIGSQRIHSTCSPTDLIFIIFESGEKGSLFCNGKKRSRFDSAQPNDTSKKCLVSLVFPTQISTFSRPTSKGLEIFLKFSPF